jgi:hypothetical protein
MKQRILNILRERNLDTKRFNVEILYKAGINNIVDNIEFYIDKPYTCESVLKELFKRGVLEQIEKTQSRL